VLGLDTKKPINDILRGDNIKFIQQKMLRRKK